MGKFFGSVGGWIWSHKAFLSYPVGLIGAGVKAKGNDAVGDAIVLLAAWLNGGGHTESDRSVKANQ